MNIKKISVTIGAVVIALVITYIAFYFIFLDLFVDLWWFDSLGYKNYFWLRLLYRFFIFAGITLFFFSIFFLHFWLASGFLGLNQSDDLEQNPVKLKKFELYAHQFLNGSLKISTPVSIILAILIAIPFYNQWEQAILYFFGESTGTKDPLYGKDISYYLFSFPIYQLIQRELLITALAAFLMISLQYWLEHHYVPSQKKEYPLTAKIHLVILIGFVVLWASWGFMLDRYALLYIDSHEPVFYGPGFVEIRYKLPLIWLAIFSFVCASILAVIYVISGWRTGAKPLVIVMVCFLIVTTLEKVPFIPKIINQFIVQPNPVSTEKPFMQNNIQATLDAYKLNDVKTIDYEVKLDPAEDIAKWSHDKHLENIPLWDREYLIDVYNQLQGIRPYYQFSGVDEDRYLLHGHKQQVNVAARELNLSKLPVEAQNWENKHLRYTHGYGVAMSPAAQDAGGPIGWFIRDLNMHSNIGFNIKLPDIYFGLEDYPYVIEPNKLRVRNSADEENALEKEFIGKSGIPIPSLFRKLLFSFYFKDEKIFFSPNITKQSKILIHRNIVERIKKIAPYLVLDSDPYIVVTEDNFFWIQDAYTTSVWYPASKPLTIEPSSAERRDVNFIRNAVKIVVNAYDGSVQFYMPDPESPIIRAYKRAYPGLFKPISQMPVNLQQHLRYPRDLFQWQMQIYAKYHQKKPELFFQQAETWQFAHANNKVVAPYYITTDLANCAEQEDFFLLNPMTPIKRQNLSILAAANATHSDACDGIYSTGITIFKFKKETQVNGPAQVDALIDQDPDVSSLITLWDQRGSQVIKGRMVILPMGNSVLYVQPLYLMSTTTKIPELVRVIVSIGNEVVIDKTLKSALKRISKIFIKQGQQNGENYNTPQKLDQ